MANFYLNNIIKNYSTEELVHVCKCLNKEYNIYDPNEVRWKKISYALYKTTESEISQLRKAALSNEIVNELLMRYYICERVVKYHFIRTLKSSPDDIVAFEMSIGDSRIDICRINGGSYAYEIKTEYDNFDRLDSQMKDYFNAFEKVYVIVPINHVDSIKKHIPEKCGIIAYRLDENFNLVFSYKRAASENKCNIDFCLSNLSSSDMIKLLKLLNGTISSTKQDNFESLKEISSRKNIWPSYRQFLRDKYKTQWLFLKEHFDDILPIDVQNFFSAQVNPSILYDRKKISHSN